MDSTILIGAVIILFGLMIALVSILTAIIYLKKEEIQHHMELYMHQHNMSKEDLYATHIKYVQYLSTLEEEAVIFDEIVKSITKDDKQKKGS